ncbi:MAG: HAMP domain-containing protein, partial [Clostridia bacterium]|nr:HAMP domain-containing protein [Clostridia bacterium]
MGKLRKAIARIPLMPSLIIVMSFFIILAVILSKTTTSFANEQIQLIGAKYTVFEEKTEVDDESEHGIVRTLYIDVLPFSEEDKQAYDFYTVIYEYSSFFWCIVSITIGAVIFYFGKLQKPIKLLINASENISDDNLDFVIDYSGKDELGQLCSSFEKMRLSLMDNNRTMW